ncbi:MAG: peptidylprolyl isomerase [Planctomycetes bacterium]|nr:peptidylprolyl isomerase [Planctomycetota bacterium]
MATASLAASLGRPVAQEAPIPEAPKAETTAAYAVPASEFLTAEDAEYLTHALNCVDLAPADLNYEKKHLDHKLRLKVCDRALDEPCSVPGTAAEAAREFNVKALPSQHCRYASKLLDLPQERWTPEELQLDAGELGLTTKSLISAMDERSLLITRWRDRVPKKEVESLDKEIEALSARCRELERGVLFGGEPRSLLVQDSPDNANPLDKSQYYAPFFAAVSAQTRDGERLTPEEKQQLAHHLPATVAEAEVSLATKVPAASPQYLYEVGSRAPLPGLLVSASRTSLILQSLAGRIRSQLAVRKWQQVGTPSTLKGITGGILAAWEGPNGRFVIGGTGPNTYEGDDFIGIIDLGGDDLYRGRVACGLGLEGRSALSFVLDLSGNDRYEGSDFTQGFGFLGVGILHDLGGGNDTYQARYAAQGCGLCGVGELYDDGGDDLYVADSGAQGAAAFGYGRLADAAGNDIYRGARYVQAFAQVKGIGVLADGAGNDLYFAGAKYLHQPLWNDRYQSLSQGFAIGNRYEGTGGGVALLLDEGDGNDVYQSDIYGQGSSYWFSLGLLVDRGGNDTYTSGQYCQGAGIHLSAAALMDLKGNDTYSMGVGLGQGAAHDWAVGWLIDRAGNDFFQGNGQGMGLNFSVGILLDCAGDDSHCTNNEGSIGKGSNHDISLLLDLGGTDSYGPKDTKDGSFTRRDRCGLVYDVPAGWFPGVDPATLPTKQEPAPVKSVVQHILIAWDGTGVDTQKQPRTKEQAAEQARKVLKLARATGADWPRLQADHNEDCSANEDGSVNTHNKYTATPEARLVKPFLDCALRLGVGQVDLCESKYGFHIIKRVE